MSETDAGATESPEAFLEALGVRLNDRVDDTDLATVLANHLITAEPTHDAVAVAKAAILKMAAERAKRMTPGPVDG